MVKTSAVTLQMVYEKLENIDNKLDMVERILVPEIRLSSVELQDLQKRKKEIKSGQYLSEKQLFNLLKE